MAFRQCWLILLLLALAELLSPLRSEADFTYPNGSYVTNVLDSLQRVTDIYYKLSNHSTLSHHGYQFNAQNWRTQHTHTDGHYTDYTYDNIGQLKTATGKESGGATRLHEKFGYAYDAAHNLNTRTNNALLQTFSVDSRNRLTSAGRSGTLTVAGATSTAATSVTVNGSSATLYADNSFAKAGVTPVNGTNTFTAIAQDGAGQSDTNSVTINLPASVSFTYDANGNLTSDGRFTYAYDGNDRLTSATDTVTGTYTAWFAYDAFERLCRLRENGAAGTTNEVQYVYAGNLVVQERHFHPPSSPTAPYRIIHYTRGLDLSGTFEGAGGIGGLLARTDSATGQSAYYHSDGNGNVTLLVNPQQVPVAKYTYDPFGNTLAMSGPLAEANTYRFSSKEINAGTGLYYFGERFYNPNLQRWLNPDPAGMADGPNLYAYVGNGPTYAFDPWGLVLITANEGTAARYEARLGPASEIRHILLTAGFIDQNDVIDWNTDTRYWDVPDAIVIAALRTIPQEEDAPRNSLKQLWADELEAWDDLREGAETAVKFRDETGKELLYGMAGTYLGKYVSALRRARLARRAANQLHHSLPKFLGGNASQILTKLDSTIHTEFHQMLRQNLKNVNIPLDAASSSHFEAVREPAG